MKLNFLFILTAFVFFSCTETNKKYIEDEISNQRQIDSVLIFEGGLNIDRFLHSQKKKTTTFFQLKGNVSEITQTNYWFKKGTTKTLKKLATDKFEFNTMNQLTLHNSYANDGELFYLNNYSYDDEGYNVNYSESNEVRFVVNTTPSYSLDGLIFKETHYNRDEIPIGESIIDFDANKNLITKTTTWTGGKTKNKTVSKIDSLGNEIFNINYESVIDKPFADFAETANEFDYKNNIITDERQYLPWGIFPDYKERLNLTIKNKYDTNNLLTESTYFKKDGSVDYVLTYTYSLDSNNNWIVQTILKNGAKYSQLEREISYHPNTTK